MEGSYVMLHAKLGPAHAVRNSFLQRAPVGPAIMRNAVAGNYGTGAIGTPPTMYENRIFRVGQKIQCLRDLIVGRRMHSIQRDIDIMHAGRLYRLLFRFARMFVVRAKVDDGFDSQFRQTCPSFALRLCAAINPCAYLMEVGYALWRSVGGECPQT
jgi:hypothetical protein